MKLLRGSHNLHELSKGSVVTIGNFDGVHLGHKALFTRLRTQADAFNLPLLAVLFEPQPSEYLLKEIAPPRLFSLQEKLQVMQSLNIDFVYCLRFNQSLAVIEPIEFIQKFIINLFKTKFLLIGKDFRFGHNRKGDIELLQKFANQSYDIEIFPEVIFDNARISSTRIRQALQNDHLDEATKLLGQNYFLCGRVEKGHGRGRTLGIPTANITLGRRKIPLNGVYCVQVRIKNLWYYGVANIGTRPTVDGSKIAFEVHLFDFNKDIYNHKVQVFFIKKLRDEIKFPAIEDLIEQILQDIVQAKQYFKNHPHALTLRSTMNA